MSRLRRGPMVAGVLAVVLAGVAGGAGGVGLGGAATVADGAAGAMARHEVRMRSVAFAPRALTIRLGDTVLFRNTDVVRHNAVRREVFDTGELGSGEIYSWVPADTGSFRYQCTIHTRMRGEVRVIHE